MLQGCQHWLRQCVFKKPTSGCKALLVATLILDPTRNSRAERTQAHQNLGLLSLHAPNAAPTLSRRCAPHPLHPTGGTLHPHGALGFHPRPVRRDVGEETSVLFVFCSCLFFNHHVFGTDFRGLGAALGSLCSWSCPVVTDVTYPHLPAADGRE